MKYLIIIIAIITLTGMGLWIGQTVSDYQRDKDTVKYQIYSGRLYLEQDEYSQFKKYLADNPDIIINKMDVYSSPDTLVDFELMVMGDTVVEYGELVKTAFLDGRDIGLTISLLCFISFVGGLALFIITALPLHIWGLL